MITRLSPAVLVSTVMGAWFLSNAFAQLLAAIIALFTRVGDSGAAGAIPPPCDTLHNYADVYGMIAIAAVISAAVCLALVPLLKKWMHEGEQAVA
jgi:dipeptide/tripeptide permease